MAYRVLLADDSITIQKVVELILSDEDVEVESVSDGLEALESLSRYRPDVVLADIEMPRMNGYQLCERIKGDPETRSVPVILLAGAFESFDEDRARAAGAEEFIIKPFDSSDLLGKIQAVRSQPEEIIEELNEEESFGEAAVGAGLDEFPGEGLRAPGPEPEPVAVAEVLGPDQDMFAEDVPEAEPAEETEEEAPAVEEPPAREPWGAPHPLEPEFGPRPGVCGETSPQEPAIGGTDEDEETLVVSGEDFDEEDLWDAEEIALSGQADDEAEADAAVVAPAAVPAYPPVGSPPPAETEEQEPPAPEIEEVATAAPEPEPPLEEVPPVPAEAEEIETETEPPAEEPVAGPAEEAVPDTLPEPEEPVAAPSLAEAETVSAPGAEELEMSLARTLEGRLPDRSAMEELMARKLESLLPDQAAIQETLERAVSARVASGLDVDRVIGTRLEKFETDLRDSMSSIIENRLVPAFTSSVESILWDVIPQATERLLQQTVKEAVSSAVNEKIASISQETLPGLADSLISKIIEKIRTG